MHIRRFVSCLFALIACGSLGLACNNPPGALKLHLVPERAEIRSGEPFRFEAIFSADKGRICFDRPTRDNLEVELVNIATAESQRPVKIYSCGLNGLFLLPLAPAFYVGAGLDIADAADRYVVVSPGDPHHVALDLGALMNGSNRAGHPGDSDVPEHRQEPYWPSPGQYRLNMKFQSDLSGVFPPPLFWTLYEQPVEATMTLTVTADN